MYKLWIAIYKEVLLLIRDIGGLVILFLMPLVLVITVTLIQDGSFEKNEKNKIPVLFVDHDKGELSATIVKSLEHEKVFEIVNNYNGLPVGESQANELVLKGKFKFAIIIPQNLSKNLQHRVAQNVSEILEEIGMSEEKSNTIQQPIVAQDIKLYFDPATHFSFKNNIKSSIENMVSKLESQSIYAAFQKELEVEGELFDKESFITFTEINPHHSTGEIKPNSVQHNVPAWALFAIFFIVIPLSINIVKEKNQGTFVRLKTNPVSFITIYGGKVVVYLVVCLLQFLLMMMVGIYLFPHIGLPEFTVNGSYFLLFVVALFSGLAAIGFGILLGILAKTPEQSAPFGATSVVILAAIGGVWIPVFMMPKILQFFAHLSPMNWGLNAFYDVIIRAGNWIDILPEISLLLVFFVAMLTIAFYYDKSKRAI